MGDDMAIALMAAITILSQLLTGYMFIQWQRAQREFVNVLVAEKAPVYTNLQQRAQRPVADLTALDEDLPDGM